MTRAEFVEYLKRPIPEVIGEALKAWARGEASSDQQHKAYHYIIYHIAGIDQEEFALPSSIDEMAWRNGRRFVGLEILRLCAAPMDGVVPKLPPARSQTETKRRRELGLS